jgi:hypothetical protein
MGLHVRRIGACCNRKNPPVTIILIPESFLPTSRAIRSTGIGGADWYTAPHPLADGAALMRRWCNGAKTLAELTADNDMVLPTDWDSHAVIKLRETELE